MVAANSDDPFDALSAQTVDVTNQDADSVGIAVSTASLSVSEGGAGQGFSIILNTQPAGGASVSFSLNASNGECGVTPTNATIANGDWASGASFTVNAVDDALDDGDLTCTIQIGVTSSGDGDYNSLDPNDITVTALDNDHALTLASDGNGAASVSGDGIYATGETVTLTATPEPGSHFVA